MIHPSLQDLAQMFNRAFSRCFKLKKFLIFFLILLIGGAIFLFFQGIAHNAPTWLELPLKCFPLFILVGCLLAGGALMSVFYQEEQKLEAQTMRETFVSSWELVLRAFYFALPLFLAFVVIWILLGLFMLLKAIPFLGVVFGIILAFAPFLLTLAALLLFVAALCMLFFVTPLLAVEEKLTLHLVKQRLFGSVFLNLLHLGAAFVPIWIVWLFLSKSAWLTYQIYSVGDAPAVIALQGFFMLIPFLAILTPVLTFFFNFATEAYIFMSSQAEENTL